MGEASGRERADDGATPSFTFIMPAYNEAAVIGESLASIVEICRPGSFEILVVDHGSTDATAAVVTAHGARIIDGSSCPTIASLRNAAAEQARADILVFLDADVSLTHAWGERIAHWTAILATRPFDFVTGSRCGISKRRTWVERAWFQPMVEDLRCRYINSGHLIMSRALFARVGGFEPGLRTGEDCDLCRRAVTAGARVECDPRLRVIHDGYPKSIREFFGRERWHGQEDLASFGNFLRSRAAQAGVVYTGLWVSGLATAVVMESWTVLGATVVICAGAPLVGTIWRQRSRRTNLVGAAVLLAVYLLARGTAGFARRKRWRQAEAGRN